MEKLTDLIEQSSKQHYHTLAIIVDSEIDKEKIENTTSFLISLGWEAYNVEEVILNMLDEIPENKIKLRINEEIKKWTYTLNKKSILTNSNILSSDSLGTKGVLPTFKYLFRDEKEAIIFVDAKVRDNNTAYYSEPGKDDYQEYDLSEIIYIDINDIILD